MFSALVSRLPLDPLLRQCWVGYILGHAAIALAVLVLAWASPAHAQTIAASAPTWFNSPVAQMALETSIAIFGPLLVGLVLAVLGRLYGLLGLKQTAENRATVEQVLARALAFGRQNVGVHPTVGVVPDDLHGEVLRLAAGYAFNRAPKALAKVGVTSEFSGPLETMLTSRLGGEAPVAPRVEVAPRIEVIAPSQPRAR